MIELEKKWLLRGAPNFEKLGFERVSFEEYVQTYLNKNERIRSIENLLEQAPIKFMHYIKEKIGRGQSLEDFREIDEDEYDELYTKGVRELTKVRLTLKDPESGLLYEFDEFDFEAPRLKLLMLEVEFQDLHIDMDEVDLNFQLPDLIKQEVLADVTGLYSCSNWSLAEEI